MKPLMLQERRLLARRAGGAFTLVELLVVIGIIALLIGILIPVVGKVRSASRNAAAQAQVSALKTAIDRYYSDFKAYPGPVSNAAVGSSTMSAADEVMDANGIINTNLTMSENLVLGLLGGLKASAGAGSEYDPTLVGRGPMSLNRSQPKRYEPYLEGAQLSWSDGQGVDGANTLNGLFTDDASNSTARAAGGFDSSVPEFVDPYPNPMPILYFRANRGAPGVISDANGVVGGLPGPFQYDIGQNFAYLKQDGQGYFIGVGKDVNLANFTPIPPADKIPHGISTYANNSSLQKGQAGYVYPYDSLAYFRSPNSSVTDNATGEARAKDTYILIAAGPDRVYGTEDDITSFGAVVP